MNTDKLEIIANNIEDCINVMGNHENMKYLVNKVLCFHRTLNQKFTGDFIIEFVKQMALNYKDGNYDGRNETACRYCNAMWEGLKKENPYITDDINTSLPLI